MHRIYFDYASTTPMDPEVRKAMEPYLFEHFGNPSSPHSIGREAQKALEESRETLARFIGANAQEIVFNSGATEGNNHAIFGVARALSNRGKHIIVSSVEHHSVLEPAAYLEKEGYSVTYLNVNEYGLVSLEEIQKAIRPDTILIGVMHASNEIGTIQPIAEIGKIARANKITFLVDAVQTVGHIPVNVNELSVDLLSLSAHKFYGPKGVGALYIRKGVKINPFLLGGDQEREQRASTQNVAGAVGLAKAIELCEGSGKNSPTPHPEERRDEGSHEIPQPHGLRDDQSGSIKKYPSTGQLCQSKMVDEINGQKLLRDKLLKEVPQLVKGVRINGHPAERLPNNAHFSFEGIQSESLLMSLDMQGICASMGSACTSGAMSPSHVLKAIGLSDELAFGALRISLGRWTTEEHINYFLQELPKIVKRLRV